MELINLKAVPEQIWVGQPNTLQEAAAYQAGFQDAREPQARLTRQETLREVVAGWDSLWSGRMSLGEVWAKRESFIEQLRQEAENK